MKNTYVQINVYEITFARVFGCHEQKKNKNKNKKTNAFWRGAKLCDKSFLMNYKNMALSTPDWLERE